jgi:transcriptional regulator with XRE-family HTH domain
MDDAKVGRALRSIRQHLGLRQVDVAARAGLSQQVVSDLESFGLDRVSAGVARRVAAALGAEVWVTVRWRGAQIDRVRDEAHAEVVAETSTLLEAAGWSIAAEVTYASYGERGSIDLLAFHAPTRMLLVVEAKTEIASVEETLRRHDQKVRLGRRIALERLGWSAADVTRLLAVRDTRTARRRVERHGGVFGRAYPIRGWGARGWLSLPARTPGLLLFLSGTAHSGGSQGSATIRRVRRPRSRATGSAEGASKRSWAGPAPALAVRDRRFGPQGF